MYVLAPRWNRARRRPSIFLAVIVVLSSALATVLLGGPTIAEASALATFNKAGSYPWTVPSGVHRVTFDVYGASGGNYVASNVLRFTGGLGGEAKGTFSVKPGQTFLVIVGGRGYDNGGSGFSWNGGAEGGIYGGGGGGGSTVAIGGKGNHCASVYACDSFDRIIVGGGGGGAGSANSGGNGGGITGGSSSGGEYVEQEQGQDYCDAAHDFLGGCIYRGGSGQQISGSRAAGGGGGWFGGWGAFKASDGAGGGSGYVSSLADNGSFPGATHSGDGLIVIKTA
jgi:Glycine rich protein